jgi:hypothetical protein
MASTLTFNKTVAARTRAAEHIRANPELLPQYENLGGLAADLQQIAESGRRAEVLSQVRGATKADGTAATMEVLEAFANLQREYVAVMAVLQAVQVDLDRANAPADLRAAAKKILANEAAVVITTVPKDDETTKKVAVKSKSQEALRAEIRKDAEAILALPALLDALAKRKVTKARIQALSNAADALAGRLATRTAKQGAGKDATKEVADAVREQRRVWGGCYRILKLLGHRDERVRSLLAEGAK